jgi:hypothetical protein
MMSNQKGGVFSDGHQKGTSPGLCCSCFTNGLILTAVELTIIASAIFFTAKGDLCYFPIFLQQSHCFHHSTKRKRTISIFARLQNVFGF